MNGTCHINQINLACAKSIKSERNLISFYIWTLISPYKLISYCWYLYRTAGILAIVISWVITFYSFWQLIILHEIVPGKRFDRYPELGQHCFGPKLGYWIIMPQQLIVQVASSIVYSVTGGKSLKKFFDLVIPSWADVRQTYFILFFTVCQLVISQTPNFNSLKGISLIAAVMSCGYIIFHILSFLFSSSYIYLHEIVFICSIWMLLISGGEGVQALLKPQFLVLIWNIN